MHKFSFNTGGLWCANLRLHIPVWGPRTSEVVLQQTLSLGQWSPGVFVAFYYMNCTQDNFKRNKCIGQPGSASAEQLKAKSGLGYMYFF